MTLLYTYLFSALGMSFLCSLLEATILSVTHSHILLKVKKGHLSGRILRRLKENIDRPLSAILTLNTIANTMGAVGVGAEVQKIFGHAYIAVSSGLLTFTILLFSEIIPKSLGASRWRHLSTFAAYAIQIQIIITYPFVLIFNQVSKMIFKDVFHPKVTREEVVQVAETGQLEGILQENEARVIKNLLKLNKTLVRDVMTPLSVVFALQKNETVGDVVQVLENHYFSRIPVYAKSIDNVVGLVFRDAILQAASDDERDFTMGSFMTPIFSVHDTDTVAKALDLFIQRHEHLFIVKNIKDRIVGIMTLEDAIETLLGVEIVDEVDDVADMRVLADKIKKQNSQKFTVEEITSSSTD